MNEKDKQIEKLDLINKSIEFSPLLQPGFGVVGHIYHSIIPKYKLPILDFWGGLVLEFTCTV